MRGAYAAEYRRALFTIKYRIGDKIEGATGLGPHDAYDCVTNVFGVHEVDCNLARRRREAENLGRNSVTGTRFR